MGLPACVGEDRLPACMRSEGGGGHEVPCFTYCQCIDTLSTEVVSKGDLVCRFDCNPHPLLGSGGA
jgi:hypothetical protein